MISSKTIQFLCIYSPLVIYLIHILTHNHLHIFIFIASIIYNEIIEKCDRIMKHFIKILFKLATCTEPTPKNGQISPLGHNGVYHEDNTVFFSCDYGYKLTGFNSSTCQADGTWEPQPATCTQG